MSAPTTCLPLTGAMFRHVLAALDQQGVDDVNWAESLAAPTHEDDFARDVIFVICNSGMKYTVAWGIYQRCIAALEANEDVGLAFRHPGKSKAIAKVWADRVGLYQAYLQTRDQLAFLAELPWIGQITKYHLAKNFGLDFAKPDLHLQRLADLEGCTVQALCERLAAETGYRVATVDTILWRACANGLIDSRSGALHYSDKRGKR